MMSMVDILLKENADLQAGYDAARLEIASLQAQLEAVGAGGVSALVGASQGQPVGAAPVAWLRNLTDPRPHAVTSLSYRSAADSDAGVEYVPVYTTPQPAAQALDARAEQALLEVLAAVQRYLPPDGPSAHDTLTAIIKIIDPWPLGDRKGKASSVYSRSMDLVRVFWQQHTHADALSMTMAELHDDVELVIRAARGAAQAAPSNGALAAPAQAVPDGRATVIAWRINGTSVLGHGEVKGGWIDGAPTGAQIADFQDNAPNTTLEYAYAAAGVAAAQPVAGPSQPVAEPAPFGSPENKLLNYRTPSDLLQDACNWSLTYDDSGVWESSCGEEWIFIDGGPAENSVRFCHGCGKPVAIEDQQGEKK